MQLVLSGVPRTSHWTTLEIVTIFFSIITAGLVLGLLVCVRYRLADKAALRNIGIQLGCTGEEHDLFGKLERLVGDVRNDLDQRDQLIDSLSSSLDAIPVGVMFYDSEGVTVHANTDVVRFLEGRHGDLLVGDVINNLVSRSHSEPVVEEVHLAGPPIRYVRVSSFPVEGGSGVILVEDATEYRRALDMQRDFVANISHELKTPIGALALLAETLGEEEDPEVIHRLLARLETEASRAGAILEGLLALSETEASSAVDTDLIDLSEVVREAVGWAAPRASKKSVEVFFDYPEDSTEYLVLGSRSHLASAIHNLVDNAIKYSDDGDRVVVGLGSDACEVIVEVIDSGIGIPERDVDRIFERFYRVDKARSRGTGGTGLGLSLVKKVAELHGGTIQVQSTEGIGSTFSFRLPRQDRDRQEPPK